MQKEIIDNLTDPRAYRRVDTTASSRWLDMLPRWASNFLVRWFKAGGPPVYPRHINQWGYYDHGDGRVMLFPLMTDYDVARSLTGGYNLSQIMTSFWTYCHAVAGGKQDNPTFKEFPKERLNTILAYLAHWLAAPSWSSDVCKHHGIPDLELGEFISKYWNTLGNIQTPKELYGFLVAMMEDGLEPVNPPEASDYDANPVKIAR